MLRKTRERIQALENMCAYLGAEIVRLRNDQTDVLFGFAQDIADLKEALGGFDELAGAQRLAYTEQVKKDIGFQNMMNY